MKDNNVANIWRLDNPPAGASVWPYLVGHLTSYGKSYHHSYPDYFCPHVITKGKGTIKTSDYMFDVGAGDMFTLWPGVEIEYFDKTESPWEFYYFHIEGSAMKQLVEACGFRKNMIFLKPCDPNNVADVFSTMYQLLGQQNPHDDFRILSLLYTLPTFCTAYKTSKSEDKNKEFLFKAETLINTQLATGINVNELCSKLGISRITLFRIFQKELKLTPIEYITQKRISKAKELLLSSQGTLEIIAKLSGFQSEKYFIRRFKESEGITPGEFRKTDR